MLLLPCVSVPVLSAANLCCREQVIQPMGITPSGTLAPMENALRDMADERSSSDSDLGLD